MDKNNIFSSCKNIASIEIIDLKLMMKRIGYELPSIGYTIYLTYKVIEDRDKIGRW